MGKKLEGKNRIIKKSADGAEFISDKERIAVPAPIVEGFVDKTGSGDVLAGVFLVLLAQGNETTYALKEAVRVASLSTVDFGVEHLVNKLGFKSKETLGLPRNKEIL